MHSISLNLIFQLHSTPEEVGTAQSDRDNFPDSMKHDMTKTSRDVGILQHMMIELLRMFACLLYFWLQEHCGIYTI